jgi:hypothetical protein
MGSTKDSPTLLHQFPSAFLQVTLVWVILEKILPREI